MSDYTTAEIAQAIADMQANGASNADIAQAAASAGVSVAELSAATGASTDAIMQVYNDAGITPVGTPTQSEPPAPTPEPQQTATPEPAAPVAPSLGLLNNGVQNVGGVNYDNSPVGLGNDVNMNAPTPKTADLGQYNNQTQQGIQRAGLDTTMNTVANGGNLTAIIGQGLTPQAVGAYKDASGNMIQAAPNTFVVSNPDGSGGALNYFFTVDPKTGNTAPIANPGQNLTYTPGSPGGFINGLVSSAGDIIKTVAPIALDVALISAGIDPVTAGAITGGAGAAANGGNIIQGALAGGAAGYTGGLASGAVGAGSPILSGAAGGAAAGATNAALTGQDILKGAATGGIVGSGAGYAGLGGTGSTGPDSTNNLINQDINDMIAKNPDITPAEVAHGLAVNGWLPEEVGAALGANSAITQASNEAYIQDLANTPMNTGGATTPAAPATPDWANKLVDAWNSGSDNADAEINQIIKDNGLNTDEIAKTLNITDPNTVKLVDSYVNSANGTPGTTTTGGTGGGDLNTVTVTAPGVTAPTAPVVPVTGGGGNTLNTVTVTAPGAQPPTKPVVPVEDGTNLNTVTVTAHPLTPLVIPPVVPVVNPPVVNPPVVPKQPPVQPPVPPTPPVVPVTVTPKVTQTSVGPTTLPPTTFGTSPVANVNTGAGYLNPGLIQAQTYYKNDTSPVQSQYYWGAHPFQTGGANGQTFDPTLYNQVPGGTHPWGLQQMGTALTTAQLQALINGQNITPGVVPGPVAPTAVKA
jgi:hypothetical protein